MKQITYIISFIFWNTFLAMDNPGNTSLLKRLPGDMRRNIKKLVQEGQQEDKHLVVIPNLSTKSPEDYIKSTVWNRFGPVNWHYLWNKSTPGQISFYQVGPTGNLMHLSSGECHMFLSTQQLDGKSVQADGPNNTNDVLIVGHTPNEPKHTIYFLLNKLISSQDKTVKKCSFNTIAGQRLVTMALAACHFFAILGQEHTNSHILSWYTYNDNRVTHLASRTKLPGHLTQVAFISPHVILGLTTDKRLVSLWLDAQNRLRFVLHKTPFAVEKFAIDPQNAGLIAFIFNGTENREVIERCPLGFRPSCKITVDSPYVALAISSLKNRDQNGRCLFKTKKLERAPKTLEFADGVVVITQEGHRPEIVPFHFRGYPAEAKPTEETVCFKVPESLFKQFIF